MNAINGTSLKNLNASTIHRLSAAQEAHQWTIEETCRMAESVMVARACAVHEAAQLMRGTFTIDGTIYFANA